MKSFIITILFISSIFLTDHYSQDITATLAGNTSTEGFSVVNADEETVFRITGEGNVGIGTTTPTKLFEVIGGNNSVANGKSIEINAQSSSYGLAGSITLRAGFGSSGSGNGGDLNLYSGGSQDYGGNVNIISGAGSFGPGDINIHTGTTNHYGGKISIYTEQANLGGNSIEIYTKESGASGNDITISSGDASELIGGSVLISAGNGSGYEADGGNVVLTPGQPNFTGSDGLVKVNGSGTYTGNWTQVSDERFKQDIKPLEENLSSILELNGVSYEFKTKEYPERNFSKGKQIGLIAQDVEEVLPELVETDSEGYKSIAYQNMVAVLIEAIKEQQTQIENLSKKIETLEKQIRRDIIEVSSLNK